MSCIVGVDRRLVVAAGALAAVAALGGDAAAQTPPPPAASAAMTATPVADDQSRLALAQMASRLIHGAIPRAYEKQKDWGATTEVPVGVRIDGKPFHYHVKRRTKTVNHRVWKHYKLRILDPQRDLAVTVTNLRPLGPGRVGATLQVDAKIDVWARAKVYRYGVHLIAVEMEGDARGRLILDGELGVKIKLVDATPVVALEPTVKASQLVLEDFLIRRVSDAKGPFVRELSDGVRNLLEEELAEPQLTAKIRRAIDKQRDRLTLRPGEFMAGAWGPLAELAEAAEPRAPMTAVSQPAAVSPE